MWLFQVLWQKVMICVGVWFEWNIWVCMFRLLNIMCCVMLVVCVLFGSGGCGYELVSVIVGSIVSVGSRRWWLMGIFVGCQFVGWNDVWSCVVEFEFVEVWSEDVVDDWDFVEDVDYFVGDVVEVVVQLCGWYQWVDDVVYGVVVVGVFVFEIFICVGGVLGVGQQYGVCGKIQLYCVQWVEKGEWVVVVVGDFFWLCVCFGGYQFFCVGWKVVECFCCFVDDCYGFVEIVW